MTAEDGTRKSYDLTVNRPVYCTATTTAVTMVSSTPSTGLVSDCNILMEARDILTGVSTYDPPILDWSTGRPMDRWRAVKVTDGRVTELNIDISRGATFYTDSLLGRLPPALGGLAELRVLKIDGQGLRGAIPDQIGNLSKLTTLNLASNRSVFTVDGVPYPGLSGPIPASLGNLSMLTTLNLNSNSLGGPIPNSMRRLTSLRTLDLGRNVEVSFFQQPVNLTSGLTGNIPNWLDELTGLETLDLRLQSPDRGDTAQHRLVDGTQQPGAREEPPDRLRPRLTVPRYRIDINPQRNTFNIRTYDLPHCPRPNAPHVTVASELDAQFTVTYTVTVPFGGQPVTHLAYRLSPDGGATWSPDWTTIPDSGPGGANAGSYTFDGLENGTAYTLQIRGVNIDGHGVAAVVTATPHLPSSDATLRALTVQAGTVDVALNPAFAPTTASYTAMVGQSAQTVTVMATPNDANARVAATPMPMRTPVWTDSRFPWPPGSTTSS